MPAARTVGIASKPGVARAAALVPELFDWLETRGIEVRMDLQTAHYAGRQDGVDREALPDGCDLVIVLGGDGTLLSVARALRGRPIPLFPVNLGGLGFLTAITTDGLYPDLEAALASSRDVAVRRMLRTEVHREGACVARYEALNDAVLTKASLARMIDLEIRVDGMFVCEYKADGLIVATPTGSTAYSLSAGGPIIFPSVAAVCLTPICPHMLTHRPVIVPDTSQVEVVCRSLDDEAYLTIDGQVGEPLKCKDRVVCRRSENSLHLIRAPRMMFFDVLRQKLKWGER